MRFLNRPKFYELAGISWILLAAIPRRIIFPLKGLFAFNYDQGRDFLAVSKIIWERDFTLIGQTTGLPGIFYGPWWYYFLTPLVFFSKGDPQKVAIFFAILAVFSVVALYLLLKVLTKNSVVSLLLATIAAFSNLWMLGPAAIWNPSLTPIFFMIMVYSIYRISQGAGSLYFFIYGSSTFLALDTTASFGALLFIIFILSPILLKKIFFKKHFLLALLGAFVVLLPRILFEFRNSFLMSKSVMSYLINPKVYGEKLSITERFTSRLDQILRIYADGFAEGNKIVMILLVIFVAFVSLVVFIQNRKLFLRIKQDSILIYLIVLFFSSIVFFTLFPDRVWDYYLVTLPTIFILLAGKIFSYGYQMKAFRLPIIGILLFLIVLNFRMELIPPYKVKWGGDGGTYVNEKKVIDFISSQKPQNYSLYTYSPAIFDYPFDYLVWWYSKRGLLQKPQDNQKIIYLIIRESSTRKYLKSGWYGDKTHDKSVLLEQKSFAGDLLVEKHLRE